MLMTTPHNPTVVPRLRLRSVLSAAFGVGLLLAGTAVLLSACGSSEGAYSAKTPYDAGSATVIGGSTPGGEYIASTASCTTPACQAVIQKCGSDGAGDAILGSDGQVLDVICYKQNVTVQDVPTDQTGTVTAGNDTVVVLDNVADGADITGDVNITGNNAVIWGAGPDVSVISGDLVVSKNNAVVRGVRITHDVTICKNDMKLVDCVIEGNLTITGNNATVAQCDVFGTVTVTGLNPTLVKDRILGSDPMTVNGFNLSCNDNHTFLDPDNDKKVQDSEVGDVVNCGSLSGSPTTQTGCDNTAPASTATGAPTSTATGAPTSTGGRL